MYIYLIVIRHTWVNRIFLERKKMPFSRENFNHNKVFIRYIFIPMKYTRMRKYTRDKKRLAQFREEREGLVKRATMLSGWSKSNSLTFGRVWRGSSTLGELIVASPARRRLWPGHPRLSHLSSPYLLPRTTPAARFGSGKGRIGNASRATIDDDVAEAMWPIARPLPAGTAFPHGPFCNKMRERRTSSINSLRLTGEFNFAHSNRDYQSCS